MSFSLPEKNHSFRDFSTIGAFPDLRCAIPVLGNVALSVQRTGMWLMIDDNSYNAWLFDRLTSESSWNYVRFSFLNIHVGRGLL